LILKYIVDKTIKVGCKSLHYFNFLASSAHK
jgi:hypothetical protein